MCSIESMGDHAHVLECVPQRIDHGPFFGSIEVTVKPKESYFSSNYHCNAIL